MQLNDEQKQAVLRWASEGLSLSDIQKKLTSEYSLSLTYMDVRFLVIELGAVLQDKKIAANVDLIKPQARPANGSAAAASRQEPDDDALPGDDIPDEAVPGGGVSVELDRIIKPGFVMSGSVVFSDGMTAAWMIDQMGRLMLDPKTKGYKPSPQDLAEFQNNLRRIFENRGM